MRNWIQTRTGVAFDLINPTPDMVRIEDIANSLAFQSRFNGHTGSSYSVAEHSVFVSRYCPPQDRLWGLLHDAHEAYVGDIVSPVKALIPGFKEIEGRIQNAICDKFGIPRKCPRSVKLADNRLLLTEKEVFFPAEAGDWGVEGEPYGSCRLCRYEPRAAREFFMWEFHWLTRGEEDAIKYDW